MLEVNGYNENFKSYWGEDGDLFVRVRNLGVKHYGLIGYAIQWHLHHKRLEETPEHVAGYSRASKKYILRSVFGRNSKVKSPG